MKTYGGVNAQIHIFLTSVLVRWEWSVPRPGRFTPEERAPGTHCTGGWVGPRAGLYDTEKRKFLTLPGLERKEIVGDKYNVLVDDFISANGKAGRSTEIP
jgi:hypothetical protein